MTYCSGFPGFAFDQVKLSLNDSFTGWPITFNPYVVFYYEFNSLGSVGGGQVSAACFSCQVNNYEFFIGMMPTIRLVEVLGNPGDREGADLRHGRTGIILERQPGWDWLSFQRRSWRIHDRPHRYHAADVDACAIRPLVRQGGLPVVRYHQHLPTGVQCRQPWYQLHVSSCISSIFVGFGGVGVAF